MSSSAVRKKRDYYEVLEVEPSASDADITKAYRKMALRLHPDKNMNRAAEAAEDFKEVQNAYAVLSDSSERAWYDGHKDQILSGTDGAPTAPDEVPLFQYTTSSCYKGFGDDAGGFFAVYRTLFETIAAEDSRYGGRSSSSSTADVPPGFGDSTTAFDGVSDFYRFWLSYQTKKTFAWRDEYKPSDMPDRFQRRAAERENQKQRDAGRREYNETLQFIVRFVRRRDPRVKAEQERQEAIRAEKERQRDLLAAAKIRERKQEKDQWFEEAAQEAAAWDAQLAEKEAMKAELAAAQAAQAARRAAELEEERMEEMTLTAAAVALLKCDACKARFKTEKLMQEHIGSSKHKSKVKQLVARGELPEGWAPSMPPPPPSGEPGPTETSSGPAVEQQRPRPAEPEQQQQVKRGSKKTETDSHDATAAVEPPPLRGDTKKNNKQKGHHKDLGDVTGVAHPTRSTSPPPSASTGATENTIKKKKEKQKKRREDAATDDDDKEDEKKQDHTASTAPVAVKATADRRGDKKQRRSADPSDGCVTTQHETLEDSDDDDDRTAPSRHTVFTAVAKHKRR